MKSKNLRKFSLVIISLLASVYGIAQDFIIKNYKLPNYTDRSEICATDSSIWVNTLSGGAARLNGSSWEYFDKTNGLLIDSVIHILYDGENAVWFMGVNGVARLKENNWEYYFMDQSYHYDGLLDRTKDDLWFKYIDTDLLKITPTDTVSFGNQNFLGIEQDSQLNYWAYDANNIYRLEGETWKQDTSFEYRWSDDFFHIDKDDNKWLLDRGKILVQKANSTIYEEVKTPFADEHTWYTVVTSDKYGNLYFGTGGQGMVIKKGNTWYHLDSSNGLSNRQVKDIDIDQNDNVWVSQLDWSSGESTVSVLLNDGWVDDINSLHGVVYLDSNNNALQDIGEPGLPNQFVKIEPGSEYVISDTDGTFTFNPVEGENTVTVLLNDFWEQGATPLSYTFTYPNTTLPSFEIGLKWKVVKDVALSLSGNALRPGFDSRFYLSARNEGSVTSNTTLALNYDSKLNFISSDIAPSVYQAGHLEWNLIDLQSLQSQSVQLMFNLPASVPIGTLIKNMASVTALDGEIDLADNFDTLKTVVTGSFDPNDKLVAEGILEERFVEIGTKLTYTIRFQNSGTDTAFVVRIKDEIDPNLEITSLEILTSSHPMSYSLEDRILTFRFPNIKLPDSIINEPASHGFVKYRIGALSSITDNTVVHNAASIYFDYNEPVLTNEVSNKFVEDLPVEIIAGTEDRLSKNSWVYPNPANSVLNISTDILAHYSKAELISSMGSSVKQFDLKESNGELKLDGTAPGLYFLKLSGERKVLLTKIIIAN